jgi:hypothetical protein
MNIKEIEEKAYRRGVAHGFALGCESRFSMNEDQISDLKLEIEIWRNDLQNKSGIPGSRFENIKMCVA